MNNYAVDLTLITQGYKSDEFGNRVPDTTEKTIQATELRISRAEFYQAAQAGIKPSRGFIIHSFEYDDETEVVYDGKRYSVIRVYPINDDELELYVERKLGDSHV